MQKLSWEATSHCDAQHLPNTPRYLPTLLPGPLPYPPLPMAPSLITQVCLPPSSIALVYQASGLPHSGPSGLQHQGQCLPVHGCSPVLLIIGLKNSLPSGLTLQRRPQGLSRALFPQNPGSPKQDSQLTVVPHKSPGLKGPLRPN